MQDDLEQRVRGLIWEVVANRDTPGEAARAIIPMVLERAAKVARDCPLYDDNQQLLNSDIRATCAAAIRAIGADR